MEEVERWRGGEVERWRGGEVERWEDTNTFYRAAHGVILVYDITFMGSFESIPIWLQVIFQLRGRRDDGEEIEWTTREWHHTHYSVGRTEKHTSQCTENSDGQ